MKALLGVAVQEAVHLALIDASIPAERDESGQTRLWTDEERQRFREDIFAIPGDALARMDPMALCQCVAVRLLGPGGWLIGDTYAGNATARDVLEASVERPDRSHVDEMTFDLLQAMKDAHTAKCADCDAPILGGEHASDCPCSSDESLEEVCIRCGEPPGFATRGPDGLVCLKCLAREEG